MFSHFHSLLLGFLFSKIEKVHTQCVEKDMAKHSKVKGFLNISRKAEIHAISKAWDERIPIVLKKYGEKKHSKIMGC